MNSVAAFNDAWVGAPHLRYNQNHSLNPSFTSYVCCASPQCTRPVIHTGRMCTHPGFTYLFGFRKYDFSEIVRCWSASWFPALIRCSNWGITQPCKCLIRVLCTRILLGFPCTFPTFLLMYKILESLSIIQLQSFKQVCDGDGFTIY